MPTIFLIFLLKLLIKGSGDNHAWSADLSGSGIEPQYYDEYGEYSYTISDWYEKNMKYELECMEISFMSLILLLIIVIGFLGLIVLILRKRRNCEQEVSYEALI